MLDPQRPPAPALPARRGRSSARRTCLLVPARPERALSLALVQHFAADLGDVELTLACAHPDVVWVCGYERGRAARIRELRRLYPHALLVVTARGPEEAFASEVLAVGADSAIAWPVDRWRLARVLRGRLQRRA